MATLTVPQLIATAAESHATLLGEDFIGWRVAIIVGFAVLLLWEIVTALTRTVSLRLPFLVLYIARLFMPKDEWKAHYKRWKPELWFVLGDRDRHWIIRFAKGMIFAVPLALRGGRLTAKASKESAAHARSRLHRLTDRTMIAMWLGLQLTLLAATLASQSLSGWWRLLSLLPLTGSLMGAVAMWRDARRRNKSAPEE
ncbi:hypothetical protein [Streptomyces longwoodensis]|uniref:hypothetical protein n=1 Tax=Streptomyces longwoodensis TaxID=68231 RepID=UPI0033EFA1B0